MYLSEDIIIWKDYQLKVKFFEVMNKGDIVFLL